MAQSVTTVYILLSVAFVLLLVKGGNSLSCEPCYRTVCSIAKFGGDGACHEEPNFTCLPVEPNCLETVPDVCGCCQVCAPGVGDSCSVYMKCQKGLKCKGMTGGLDGTCKARRTKQQRMERKERRQKKARKARNNKKLLS